jgi:Tfp pilus assembly protein PilV
MNARLRLNRSRRGIALMEVTVALFVFTVAAFALVMALSKTLDTAKQRNQIDVALRGLNNQLALLHGSRLLPGDTDAPDDGTGVQYHVSIGQANGLQDKNGVQLANLYRATITATWKEGTATETRTVSELVYQP